MLNIRVKLLSESARVPAKAHEADAGWDLFAAEEAIVPPGETRLISTGISMSIPKEWYGQIKARSGHGSKGMVVTAGVIDSGYLGEIKVVVINARPANNGNTDGPSDDFVIKIGDKVAQMVFLPVPAVEFQVVDELGESHRGNNGFGSTDRNVLTVKPGVYKHYKGNVYKVVGRARHSETEEAMVVYQAPDSTTWVRPEKMFMENVTVNGVTMPRFKFIEPAKAD